MTGPAPLPLSPPPDERLDPFPFYARMRRDCPVAFDDRTKVWAVYRYAEVRQVLSDPDIFSSDLRRVVRPRFPIRDHRPGMISSDGPRHDQLRGPVAGFFSTAAVERLEEYARDWVGKTIARFTRGRMDVVQDLAGPMPLAVMASLLGVPDQDQPQFTQWWNQWLGWRNANAPHRRRVGRAVPGPWAEELGDYIRRLATSRWAEPRNDILSAVVRLTADGERLREDEVLDFCAMLLIAGHVTTTHLIGNAVLCLLDHPSAFDQLRADPAGIPTAIEEVMRYASPVQAVSRVPLRAVEVGGQTIPAGQEVLAYIGSANRDESRFPDPDRFAPSRRPNNHIALGHGEHYCFGGPLARLQARVALEALLRLDGLARGDSEPLMPNPNPFLYGTVSLPVRFDCHLGRRPVMQG